MAKPKILVDSRIHIPIKVVDAEYIVEKLTYYDFDNAVCAKCEFRPIRPSAECRSCEFGGLEGISVLAAETEIKGKQYVTIPYGELHNFKKLTDLNPKKCEFINKTSRNKHTHPVKFTGELRDYQIEPTEDLMSELSGLLVAPPRSGKTVIGTYVGCNHGMRTIIMADQKDFLDGFYETIEQMTNLTELEEECGHKLFGFPKTDADYKNFQIILITYQSLIRESKVSKKRLKLLNENYGCVIIDEAHAVPAPTFSKTAASLRMKYRYGLTATPDRKDGKSRVLYSVIGPQVARARVKELVPHVTLHKSPDRVQSKAQYAGKGGWVRFCKFLAAHPDRNNEIIKWMIKDLERGRSIAVPIMFTDHARKLATAINEYFGEEVATVFLGGAKEAKRRKPTVDAARAGKIRVVFGTRRLMQRGINIPRWDTLYYIMPMNNKPNWKQESCRILTPMEGKKTPVIRMFVDTKMKLSVGCAKSVMKFCWDFGYQKARRTPKKMRNWLGVASDSSALEDNSLPDFFEPDKPNRTGTQRTFSRRW